MRLRLALLVCLLAAGCGGAERAYTVGDVKAAYYRAADYGTRAASMTGGFIDLDFHSHANYVPNSGLETCPLAQRANAASGGGVNEVEPKAAQPVQQFVVEPKSPDDARTPSITQGGFVFGTGTIAAAGMKQVLAAIAKCPATYEVRGGPSPILGTYNVSVRPLETGGWKGVSQQIAHTYPPGIDDVYYEDLTHVVVRRANVILFLDVTHEKVIGERADSAATAQTVLKTVLKRLG